MLDERPIEEWKDKVQPVLESKRKEFEIFGYREISCDDIWQCLVEKIWKDKKTFRLHEVVQSIFHLKINTYMDYLAIRSLNQTQKPSKDELMAQIHAVMQQEEEQKK